MNPDDLVVPLVGSVRWGRDTKGEPVALGIWGRDFPIVLHIREPDGSIRPLSRPERRWVERMAGNRRASHER
jgi:hypothetical protein